MNSNVIIALMLAEAVASLLLAVLILYRGIWKNYRWFLMFLLVRAVYIAGGVAIYGNRNLYGWYFLYTSPFRCLAPAAAAIETYNSVMRGQPNIQRMGKYALYAGVVIAVIVSTATIAVLPHLELTQLFKRVMTVEQYWRSFTLICWLLLVLFVLWVPVNLSKNTVVHAILFLAYFVLALVAPAVFLLSPHNALINLLASSIAVVLLVVWMAMLTRAGEQKMVRVVHRWNRDEEAKLLAHLKSIDTRFSKVG